MGKINRATQKIFGSNANSTAITQFGTAKDTNPIYITNGNVEDIQANPSFLTGWANSLEQDLAPFMQDSNALWYMITSQVAYIMQQGMPEYDAETEYPAGALCKNTDNYGGIVIYKALQDMLGENVGHATSEQTYWTIFSADENYAKYEIGLPQPSLTNTLLRNEIWLDGSVGTAISGTDSTLVNVSTYPLLAAKYGNKYGGNGTTTFGLPNFTGKSLWGVSSFGTGYLGATLPNIMGSFGGAESASKADLYNTGPFYTGATNKMQGGSSDNDADVTYFDAHRCNTIYQNNATVRPPSVEVRWKTRYV